MKSFIGFTLMVLSGADLSAQIVMNLQLPPAGIVLKQQLWNMSLINPEKTATMVQVEMHMTDTRTNQPVLTASSRNINIPSGVSQLRSGDLMPLTYTGINPAYRIDNNPNGFLPIGVFTVCFTVVDPRLHGGNQLAEDCATIEVEPVSPPALISPSDLDKVESLRPQFTWSPPAPMNLFGDLKYEFKLVEKLHNQTSDEAVVKNVPVYISSNNTFPNIQYPMTMPSLDTTKVYAWRIRATNNGLPIANSESWSFRVTDKTDQNISEIPAGFFTRLARSEDQAAINTNGRLFVQYDNPTSDNAASIQLFDITKPKRLEVSLSSPIQPVKFGMNYFKLPIDEMASLSNHHTYIFELSNMKGDRWYMKFTYEKIK